MVGTEIRIGGVSSARDEIQETLGGTQPVYGPAIPDVLYDSPLR